MKMKKLVLFGIVAALMVLATGCGSLRTPKTGARAKNVYYNTFFGISIEALVYGDGLVVTPMQ
jgi:hypothetical protein